MTANKNPSTGIPTPTSASARDIATSGQATAAAEQAVPSWDDIGRAVVIGGGSGMGRAIAAALVAAGSRVTIVGRSEERLARAVRELRSAAVGAAASADADAASDRTVVHSAAAVPAGPTTGGGEVDWMVADIGDEARAARLFEQIGPVDHVISTAADVGGAYGPIGEFDFAAGRGFLDTKLIGSMLVAKCARVRAGGSLTFTSGIAAYRPAAGGAMVAAVNGALESLAYALAVELGPTRVNVVSPGWVRTSIWDRLGWPDREERLAAMAGRLPAGRLGTPEDIAAAVLSLLRNPFVTGTVLHVDGGHRLV